MKRAVFISGGDTHMPNIEGMLHDRGFHVCWLKPEEEAVWRNQSEDVDVAIVSLNVLTMNENPFALVNQLRRHWPDIPVLFMLGAQAYGKKPVMQGQGGVYCVSEPVDLTLLCKFLDLLTKSAGRQKPARN